MKKLPRLTNSLLKEKEVGFEPRLREKQVNNLFREFWKLKCQYRLCQIYPEIEHSLPGFLNLYSALKKRGLNPQNRVICRHYRIGCCKTSGTLRSIPKTSRQSPRSSI